MIATEPKKLEDLSPAAQQAIATKALAGAWEAKGLKKLLAELHQWDLVAEKRKARAGKIRTGGIIGTVAGFFLFFLVGVMAEEWLIGISLLAAPVLVIIAGHRMKKAAESIDLPNELRNCVRPVLQKLSQDLHPDERIRVSLDLNGVCDKTRKSKMVPVKGAGQRKMSTYELPLGTLRLPLNDGYEMVLRFDNTVYEFQITKRGARKTKTKTKWKKESAVSATLVPPSRIEWHSARVKETINRGRGWERMVFVEKDGVQAARIERHYKFKALNEPEDTAPASDILGMMVRLAAMRPAAGAGR